MAAIRFVDFLDKLSELILHEFGRLPLMQMSDNLFQQA